MQNVGTSHLPEAWQHYQSNDFDRAYQLCRKQLSQNSRDFEALHLAALSAFKLEKPDVASRFFQKALKIEPNNDKVHMDQGIVFHTIGENEKALQCLKTAVQLSPSNAMAWNALGAVQKQMDLVDDAILAFKKAIELNPTFQHALYNLANLYEVQGRLDDLQHLLDATKDQEIMDPRFAVLQAKLYRRKQEYDLGIELLLALINDNRNSLSASQALYFELGNLFAARKQPEEAIAYYTKANTCAKEGLVGNKEIDPTRPVHTAEKVLKFIQERAPEIINYPSDDSSRTPVFLIGFPRSGTTLLDQILSSHPHVEVVEEEPFVARVRDMLENNLGAYPDSLALIGDKQRTKLQKYYWKMVDASTSGDRLCIIDKFPLNILRVPLIYSIFPNAKFIFAARHPFDACLSCFMQDFALNDAMANFLSLKNTAEFYRTTMSLWLSAQELLPINVHIVQYEKVVSDFDQEIAKVINFLGLEWDDAVKLFHETARQKKQINTPSYHQVTRNIYQDSKFKHKQYIDVLDKDFTSPLEPFCKTLGYQ